MTPTDIHGASCKKKWIFCLQLTMESWGHTILLIWINKANDNVHCDFRQLPQIYPIVSSFFYTTLCGEQDVGSTTSR